MLITDKEREELLRWDGARRGWYEVYYLKWNDLASQTACWIRYTMTSPTQGEPYCELWGIFFDAAHPENNFAVKDRSPIELFNWDRDRFLIGVAEAELAFRSCHGRIDDPARGHKLEWDLKFDSKGPTFRHFPYQAMYTTGFPKTKVLAPHQFLRISGQVVANGRTIDFADAPGQQTHIWGTKHAHRWAWGHCNAFAEDPKALWEGLDSQIKIGPITSPHMKLFYLRYKDRDYLFNSIAKIFTNKSKWSLGRWTFEARHPDLRIVGEIECEPRQIVTVTYQDPDGQTLWCNNSKIAAIKLGLFDPHGAAIAQLNSENAAAEFVDRRIYDQSPPQI